MNWLGHWWHHDILDAGKGPLCLAFVAFVVTFLSTRTITRLIRAGRGPFHNISNGGTHLHHSTPGTVLLISGAFTAVGAQGQQPWNYLAALLVGVGASLVLDEFAMIFHLQDVYWTQEGQLSVSVVCLAAATLGLAIVGISPANLADLDGGSGLVRGVIAALLAFHFVFVAVCAPAVLDAAGAARSGTRGAVRRPLGPDPDEGQRLHRWRPVAARPDVVEAVHTQRTALRLILEAKTVGFALVTRVVVERMDL